MNVIVHHRNIPHSKALEEHCRERVARAVEPFADRVQRVDVLLVDLNGHRKGPGHACRISVHLASGDAVMFGSEDRDFYVASSRAATGAGTHLARLLSKARARTHQRFASGVEAS